MQNYAVTLLSLGMVLFIGIHLLPTASGLRSGFVGRLGEDRYRGMFAAIAFAGLILIIVGKAYAPYVHLWVPPVWGRHAAHGLMLPALILLPAANMPTNIKRFTRHPMLWGVTLWALAHLLANGDLASLILFGGFGVYSLFDMWSANRRGATLSTEMLPMKKDVMVVVAGLVTYALFAFLHPYLFRVPAFV